MRSIEKIKTLTSFNQYYLLSLDFKNENKKIINTRNIMYQFHKPTHLDNFQNCQLIKKIYTAYLKKANNYIRYKYNY